MPTVPDDTQVLILYGDVPLLTEQTLRELVAVAGADNLALLTVIAEDGTKIPAKRIAPREGWIFEAPEPAPPPKEEDETPDDDD